MSVRALALACAALALAAGAAGAATRWVAPDGRDSASGATRAEAWRTIGKANASVRPGDVVRIANGTYDEFPDAAGAPPGGARIAFVGNVADPGAVKIRAGGTLARDGVTLKGLSLLGGIVITGDRDSLADARVGGRHPRLVGADDAVLVRLVVDAERFWIVGATSDTLVKAMRDTIRDCVFRLRPVGRDGPAVRFQCVSDGVFERNRWDITTPAGTIGGSPTKLFFTRRCRFADSRWNIVNECVGDCDESGWFMQRDFTQSNVWVRDTIEMGGPGPVQFFGSGSGTYPGSVMNNTYDRVIVKLWGSAAHGAAMVYQDAARWDTLTHCTLVGSASGLLINGDNAGPTLIEHCTIVGFAPTLGAFGSDAGGSTRWTGVLEARNNVFYVPPSAPKVKESAAVCLPYEAAAGHYVANRNVVYSPLGRAKSLWLSSSGGSAPGVGQPWCRQMLADSASVWGSPRFADSTGVRRFDARLMRGSRALDAVRPGLDAGAVQMRRLPRPAPR